jgi:hypothetical protein
MLREQIVNGDERQGLSVACGRLVSPAMTQGKHYEF